MSPLCAALKPIFAEQRWLLENRDEGCTESAVDGACWNGHETVVHWLVCEWGQVGTERSLDYAASTGRLEVGPTKCRNCQRIDWLVVFRIASPSIPDYSIDKAAIRMQHGSHQCEGQLSLFYWAEYHLHLGRS